MRKGERKSRSPFLYLLHLDPVDVEHELSLDNIVFCLDSFGILNDRLAIVILVYEVRYVYDSLLYDLSRHRLAFFSALLIEPRAFLSLNGDQLKGYLPLQIAYSTALFEKLQLQPSDILLPAVIYFAVNENLPVAVFIYSFPLLRTVC
jgi:hypothetical protein